MAASRERDGWYANPANTAPTGQDGQDAEKPPPPLRGAVTVQT